MPLLPALIAAGAITALISGARTRPTEGISDGMRRKLGIDVAVVTLVLRAYSAAAREPAA